MTTLDQRLVGLAQRTRKKLDALQSQISGLIASGGGGGSSNVTPEQFGAVGDGVTDDFPAFAAAVAHLKSIAVNEIGFYKASQKLDLSAATYFISDTLEITHTFAIVGQGPHGQQGPTIATKLVWPAGKTGIRIQRYNTSGANTLDGATHYGGDGFSIEGVWLYGGYAGTESDSHGIHAKARFSARRCRIENFAGDGIYSDADDGGAGNPGNSNNSRIDQVHCTGNRDGLHIAGGNSNVWTCIDLDTTANRRWGRNCRQFLSCMFVSGHSDFNGLTPGTAPGVVSNGGNRYAVVDGQEAAASVTAPSGTDDTAVWYYLGAGGVSAGINIPAWVNGMTLRACGAAAYLNNNADTVVSGSYTEGGQGPVQAIYPAMIVGGTQGAGVKGSGVWVRNYQGMLAGRVGMVNQSTGDAVQFRDFGTGSLPGLEFSTGGHGYSLQWQSNDLAWTLDNSGGSANWSYVLTGESTTNPIGKRRMNFPNGFGLASVPIVGGTAAPTGAMPNGGNWPVGSRCINIAPAVGQPKAWACTVSGSPGTWVSEGNL